MSNVAPSLPPIEEVFNPNTPEYMANPAGPCLELARRGRMVWYEPWQAWIMTQVPDIMDCWKHEYLVSDFYGWEFAPEAPPEEEWTNYERAMIGHSTMADHKHHRLIRRVTAPAFSRNVVDKIQEAIEPDIIKLFDDLGSPEVFDYKEEIARHIPFISITRMIGIPEKYWDHMQKVVMTFTEAFNPTISDERREAARQDSNKAIDIIQEVIAERRQSPSQDDFLSVLLNVVDENDDVVEWDIISLVLALIGAGADTTLIGQQWTVFALLKHPDQIEKALKTPESFANAFNEVFRWGMPSKMGFARYAPDDMEVLGQQVRKGQMILLMPHLRYGNPEYFENPETFDVERTFEPDILFGYGPRFCIGAALAKRQLYLTMTELHKRFPNAELYEEPERDETDHNAIAFKRLLIKTNL